MLIKASQMVQNEFEGIYCLQIKLSLANITGVSFCAVEMTGKIFSVHLSYLYIIVP